MEPFLSVRGMITERCKYVYVIIAVIDHG